MGNSVKRLAVLGSTGSIGQQTLDVVRALPARFRLVGLAAGKNIALLAEQIKEFKPNFVCYSSINPEDEKALAHLTNAKYELLSLEAMATHPKVDMVVIATSGKAGLAPTLAAVKAGKNIALANKESLVMAGEIIMNEAKRSRAQILPIDSEHSAIWQCLRGERQKATQLILTASGGPFRDHSAAQLKKVTVAQALKHPSWQMGKKVTIDSATLMNKGLEVIEARWLFGIHPEKIDVVIHPESIIHSMVEYQDGCVIAEMSVPDMRAPIAYALSYPERVKIGIARLDLLKAGRLTFEAPDRKKFPCLDLAYEALCVGRSGPVILNAANEIAVGAFLDGKILFTAIPETVDKTLQKIDVISCKTLEDVLDVDRQAREIARKCL